jgi:hypothetical protein
LHPLFGAFWRRIQVIQGMACLPLSCWDKVRRLKAYSLLMINPLCLKSGLTMDCMLYMVNNLFRSAIMDNHEEPTLPNADENQAIDFSNQEYLKSIEQDLIVPGDWINDNPEELTGFMMGYVDGQEDMVKILNRLLELQLPFEETVKQLTGFVAEREALIKRADLRNPDKYAP